MEIQQKDNGEKGSFYIEIEKSIVAEMTYVWAGRDRIIPDYALEKIATTFRSWNK